MTQTLALHITHAKPGLRIEECVYDNHLALRADGTYYRGRIGGWSGIPIELVNLWWAPGELQFVVFEQTRPVPTGPAELPRVNGQPVKLGTLKAGDRLEWRGFTVLVKEVMAPEPALREQAERGRSDDATLEVLADWLEADGATLAAEWTRGVLHGADRERLAVIARQLPLSVRAMVSRGPIERCDSHCGQRWEDLPIADGPTCLRRCGRCALEVSWCDSSHDIPPGGPVAICPSAARAPNDLFSVHVVG
ncbi:MAG: hypothetical protein JNM17_41225 [Archangium sp.]|nr:hypothetical protein [Archangium sp.]